METFNFISGEPRSGSTLLCNILLQNPRCHATNSSALNSIVSHIRNGWHDLSEHKAHPNDAAQTRVISGILNSYYSDIERPLIFDKGRGWPRSIEWMEKSLGRKVKILTTVRNTVDILSSLEVLHRTNCLVQSDFERNNWDLFANTGGRCEVWTNRNGLVGSPWLGIKDAFQRGLKDRLHIIPFEKLTTEPHVTMKGIYDFLEEPFFEHNFEYVEQVTVEDDRIYRLGDLHTIRNKVEPVPSMAQEILGEWTLPYNKGDWEFWKQ